MKRVYCLLITVLLPDVGSCGQDNFERKMTDRIAATCGDQAGACSLQIKDVTDFDWDTMYVFGYNATEDDVGRALGTRLPNYLEFHRKIVFVMDGRIVLSEQYLSNVERPTEGEVIFPLPAGQVYAVYTPETAVFRAQRRSFGRTTFYLLVRDADMGSSAGTGGLHTEIRTGEFKAEHSVIRDGNGRIVCAVC